MVGLEALHLLLAASLPLQRGGENVHSIARRLLGTQRRGGSTKISSVMVEQSCDCRHREMALGDTRAGAIAAAAPMGGKATGGEGTLDGVLAWSECSSFEEGAERDGPASSTST
jgi:hypothetical protein